MKVVYGKGVCFHRLRRITGYLTSSLENWNDAKQAEEKERVKHSLVIENKEVKSNANQEL